GACDRRMDCSAVHRGMRLGEGPRVPHPRPGLCLWRGVHLASAGDGHPRSTDLAAITLAKMPMQNGWSRRSGGNALTMSWCLAVEPRPTARSDTGPGLAIQSNPRL